MEEQGTVTLLEKVALRAGGGGGNADYTTVFT